MLDMIRAEEARQIAASANPEEEHAEADTLLLAVHNTGTPIDTARLAEIRNFTVKPQGHGIGLKNIYERLSMLYKTFAFTVDSTETDGTTVQILLNRQDAKEEQPHGETADR